jgi:hypothetical protein
MYNLRYKVLADYDMNLRIFQDDRLIKKYIPIDVCLFNDKGGTSNITIDSSFFSDKLALFLADKDIASKSYLLQQYYFYSGFIKFTRKEKIKGLIFCTKAFTQGPRKIFYMLVFIKFILGMLGICPRIKIV